MNNKQSDFIVKHNFRGALFLGSTVAIALLIIVGLPKGFGLPYIREVPFILLLVPVICIGIYVTWANFCLRKIVITGNECVYVNMWGRKKNFNLDNLRITFKDSENVLFYDKQGNKICRIEAYMEKYIGKLYEQLVRVLKGNKIVKQCDLALLNMQKEINI